MRNLTHVECEAVSAGSISSEDLVYHAVNGTVTSAFNSALAQAPGASGVVASALFGGLVAILSHVLADTAASAVKIKEG